jgi:hypothetical protein
MADTCFPAELTCERHTQVVGTVETDHAKDIVRRHHPLSEGAGGKERVESPRGTVAGSGTKGI